MLAKQKKTILSLQHILDDLEVNVKETLLTIH